MAVKILTGDVLDQLATLPDGCCQTCVTSPPYWGLRDYGVEGQIGLEPTPDEWVAKMVAVFGEVRRVLRDDGTAWVNMGDGYAHNGPCGGEFPDGARAPRATDAAKQKAMGYVVPDGLKPKDLIGQPWRLAFALQADGWWLRSDIIWSKPNPMPESVTDRPTKAHEYVFLLAKRARYFYDADAVREAAEYGFSKRVGDVHASQNGRRGGYSVTPGTGGNRNLRTVWTIPTHPFPDAHFATFPPKLVEPCIKAGTSERGCCPECGAPWERVVEVGESDYRRLGCHVGVDFGRCDSTPTGQGNTRTPRGTVPSLRAAMRDYVGWRTTCDHDGDPVPCVVLDPFLGSGTTALVADRLGRDAIGIELNPKYAAMARERIAGDCPMFADVE